MEEEEIPTIALVNAEQKMKQEKLFRETVIYFKDIFKAAFDHKYGIKDIDISVNVKNSEYFNVGIQFKNNKQVLTYFRPAECFTDARIMDIVIEAIDSKVQKSLSEQMIH